MGLPAFLQFTRKRPQITPAVEGEGETADPLKRVSAGGSNVVPFPSETARPALDIPETAAPRVALPEALSAPEPETAAPAPGPIVDPRTSGRAPHMRVGGETVTRSVMRPTGDRATDLREHRESLEDERNPKDRDGRWWTALKELGLGALTGFARGGLGGALAGGAVGAARGAITPNINERRERDRELGRVKGLEAEEQGRQAWQAKLREAEADIAYKQAQTDVTRAKPEETARRLELIEQKQQQQDAFNWGTLGERTRSNKERETDRDLDRDLKERSTKLLDDFRRTKMYEDIKQKGLDRKSREGIAAANREAANARAAAAQDGANARTAAGIASREKLALTGQRFKLANLANQALKDGRSLSELVNEVQTHGGEVFDDEK